MKISEKKYWYLHNHKIFEQLNDQQLKELSVLVGYFRYKKNELVHLFTDNTRRMYFLKEGILKVLSKQEDGKEVITDVIHKDNVFGEFTINNDASYTLKAASPEAVICAFTLEDFEKVMQKYPEIGLKVCKQVGEKIIEVNKKYTDIIFKDSKTRLIEFLMDFSVRYGEKKNTEVVVKNYLTQEEVASLIGCKRQTVTQFMRELQEEGKIAYTRSELIVYSTDLI